MTPKVRALYRLHRRPIRVMLGRHVLISVPMLIGFLLIAGAPVAYALPLYAAFLVFAASMLPVITLGTDRSEGTLEFLAGLPVQGRELALGRVLALLEGCVAAGVISAAGVLPFFGVGGGVGIGAGVGAGVVRVAVTGGAVFLAVALLLLASGTCLLWLSLRFRSQTLATVIPLGLIGLALVAQPFSLSLGGLWSQVLAVTESWVLMLAAVGGPSVLLLLVGFLLLERACDRVVRDPSLARPG